VLLHPVELLVAKLAAAFTLANARLDRQFHDPASCVVDPEHTFVPGCLVEFT
jgi:hypothetical protein